MPKAEAGSVKDLSKRMKMKGLQRLRFYCQVCERQMRDENGFKQHTMSESHVRNMLVVGQDSKKAIADFSDQFLKDFIQLLKTGHGEKQVQINHFYQSYIANKQHVHMNATRWPSLTEFAKYLGREGICRVEETDKGLHISWIDTSPEALRRQEALRRKEMQDRGDEELEQKMLKEQIRRAEKAAGQRGAGQMDDEADDRGLQRQDGEKVKLSFGAKPLASTKAGENSTTTDKEISNGPEETEQQQPAKDVPERGDEKPAEQASEAKPAVFKFGAKPQAKNVFAQAKKNALAGGGKKTMVEQPKKMSEAERIMREEMEKKRSRGASGSFGGAHKKQKM